ncbi:hypothetical protein PEX1_089910 [Penicillium expansum]|uniref:Uncharacterized protein n=1 Tax=Penicillium expansum TaxID=27334 RepID=A0A0A2IZJ4_PENEN|nr:hypothetical protein PEX2_050780 [Penicillium expansum]KGO48474.1 hypothetical protein PEXP_072030 [Penicillium expansum]KGO55590.1 hypothetical protein PEX2_050780 [Penicillium expansum]KGO65487.1 hypothetical protein PEX1_089910 [Penicillium expansum]
MAWSQFNIPSNGSGTPDEQQNARGICYPYESTAHQAPPSLAAEPSMFSENHLQYNTSMQHPSAPAHSSYPVPFRFTHTDFDPPNPNTVHHPSIENNRLREPSMGYLSSGPSSACTTPSGSRGSTPAMQELPQSGIGGHEIQTTYGAAQRLQPRQESVISLVPS